MTLFFNKIFNNNQKRGVKNLYFDSIIDTKRNFFISGKIVGQKYLQKENILNNLKQGYTCNIVITDKIEYVSDSFWKGFFNDIFKKYKTKDKVLELFTFDINNNKITNDLMENLEILHKLYN